MKKWIKEVLPYVIVVIAVFLFRHFIATPARIDGDSMMPTLKNKNLVIVNKISYLFTKPKRFDVVEIKVGDESLIKRIIGLPGEHVAYKDDVLYIDGKMVEENYKREITYDFSLEDLHYETIPKDMYLVLGDNRINSIDSRLFGLIKKSNIFGKSSFVIWPLKNFGSFK